MKTMAEEVDSSALPAAVSRTIIPGLPNDIAMLCLMKVPRIYHACLASVCVAWHQAVRRPHFYKERRRLGIADAWLVLVSADILSAPVLVYSAYDLSTKQLLFKVKFPPSLPAAERRLHGFNFTLKDGGGLVPEPAAAAEYTTPSMSSSLNYPEHYRIVAMNELFAVLGFSRCNRWQTPRCIFTIYNTVTDEWRHAAPLSVCREMFACGVMGDRLYVAGGVNAKGGTERTMEVYDFGADKWSRAAPLPAGVATIQADAVFQGKLYIQCTDSADVFQGPCSFWVYNPANDEWEQEGGLNAGLLVGAQQLLATDKFLYSMGAQEELFRYEPSSGKWTPVVGRRLPSRRTTASANKLRPFRAVHHSRSSQRAFGHGDDIFFLNDTQRAFPGGLHYDSVTRCHHLFAVRPSWYHAGAVVRA